MAIYTLDNGFAVSATGVRTPIVELIGESSDSMPTNVGAGSTFMATDESAIYVFDGTSWNKWSPS